MRLLKSAITVVFASLFLASIGTAANLTEDFDALLGAGETGIREWNIYDEPGANSGPSNWHITEVDGQIAILENSNIYGGDAGSDSPSRGSWIYYNGGNWDNSIFEVDMYALDDDIPGVLFRYVDENNFYVFDMNGQDSRTDGRFGRLRVCVDGQYTELGKVMETMYEKDNGIWHHIKVEILGENIKVSLDDRMLFDVMDSSIPSGSVALSAWGMNPGVAFDNVSVTEISTSPVSPMNKIATTWGELK
ncbi:DUF1080 domain-containing protein [Candidatus Poribacteria bacterium]|nr:DUF1080 domain-containing protein [Candidatus Poribacteria bacterium]